MSEYPYQAYMQKPGSQVMKPVYDPNVEMLQYIEAKEQRRESLVEGIYGVFEAGHMSAIEALEILNRAKIRVTERSAKLNQAYIDAQRIRG